MNSPYDNWTSTTTTGTIHLGDGTTGWGGFHLGGTALQGWECPNCHHVYAPSMLVCLRCPASAKDPGLLTKDEVSEPGSADSGC